MVNKNPPGEQRKEIIDIDELVTAYLQDRGVNTVVQLAVPSQSMWTRHLEFIAHTGNPDQILPDIVADANAVAIDEEIYDFHFQETCDGPQDHSRLSLYVSEDILGMDSLPLEQGMNDLECAVNEETVGINELVELAQSRANVVTVAATYSNDQIRIEIARDKLEGLNTDRFRHIRRVSIGDEEFGASITDRCIDDHIGDQIIVWRSSEANSGEPVSPQTGIKELNEVITKTR